jgi:hypothetical protein
MDKYDIVDESEDDDILADLFLEETEDGDGDGFDNDEMKSLKDQLSEKEKQINGLLQTVKSDRRKRQEMKGQLDSVTTTINSILTERQQMKESLNKSSDDDRIQIDVTEDGEAFLPKSKLDDIVAPFQSRIDELEQKLQLANQQQDADKESNQLIQSIIGEDERYGAVYPKYQRARKWVNDRVIEFQKDNNIQGQLTSGQALTHVFDEKMTSEFEKSFPGLNLAAVTTAEDSTWHFKDMLSKSAESLFSKHEPDARFRQVMNKPSGLGKSANAKGGELSLTDRVSQLGSMDIMDLNDDQIAALTKYMQNDEQKDGIKF